jgi:hypothetical protein
VDGPTGKVADILSCWAGTRKHFGPIEIYRKAGNELVRVGSKERWGGDKLDHKKIYIKRYIWFFFMILETLTQTKQMQSR